MKKIHYKIQLTVIVCIFLILSIGTRVSADSEGSEQVFANRQEGYLIYLPLITYQRVNLSIQNGGFEAGNDGSWEVASFQGFPDEIITNFELPITPHSGQYIAWLGGFQNEVADISQSVLISAEKPYLHYCAYIDSSDTGDNILGEDDFFYILINGGEAYKQKLFTAANTTGWKEMVLDLSEYKGEAVEIVLRVTTNDTTLEDPYGSNLYLEDISLQAAP